MQRSHTRVGFRRSQTLYCRFPRWMFDSKICATMRVGERPRVECSTLRELQTVIAGSGFGLQKLVVVQPQASQPIDGDADGENLATRSAHAAGPVLEKGCCAASGLNWSEPMRVEAVRSNTNESSNRAKKKKKCAPLLTASTRIGSLRSPHCGAATLSQNRPSCISRSRCEVLSICVSINGLRRLRLYHR